MAYRVPVSHLGVLAKWLKQYLPDSSRAYGLTLSNLQGHEEDQFWTDKWPDLTTVLVKTLHCPGKPKRDVKNSIAVYSTDPDKCQTLLRSKVNWKEPFSFQAVSLSTKMCIDSICKEENVSTGQDECCLAEFVATADMAASSERLCTVEDGFQFGPLKEDDAKLITSRWPYAGSDTEEYTAHYIRTYPSAGFRDDNGSLVAWGLVHRDWLPAMVHVEPQFRRRGFAGAIFTSLTKTVLKQGIIPLSRIVVDNKASIEFHYKYGYEIVRQNGIFYIFNVE